MLVRLDDAAPLPATMPAAGKTELTVHPLEASRGTILDQLAQRFDTVLMLAPATSNSGEMPVVAQADLVVLVLTAGVSSRTQAITLERHLAGYGVGSVVAVLLDRHHTIPLPLYRLLFGTRSWRFVFGGKKGQAARRSSLGFA